MSRVSEAVRYFFFSHHKYGFGVHSPFAYKLVKEVLRDKSEYPELKEISAIRKEMTRNPSMVERVDYGASDQNGTEIALKTIVRRSAVRPKYGALLFRLSRYFKPDRILELGTSLGLSTLYLAMGHPLSHILTLEGDPVLSAMAGKQFNALSLHHIQRITGPFNDTLADVTDRNGPFDMVFIDGDHRGESLLGYFQKILPSLHPRACVIIDDIYWSSDMKKAWKKIIRHPGVTLTVDLWQFGILFVDPGLSNQHYIIRY